MPHSLRAKLSGLRYKGILEDKDYKRLCHALDLEKHYKDVLDQIRDEIQKASRCSAEPHGLLDTEVVMDIIDKYR